MTDAEFPSPHDRPNAAASDFPATGRLAGIDFGTVRIGVAISDPDRVLASPFETYNRRNLEHDAAYFRALARQERIVGFVVGLPVHMSGDESQKSKQAREFGKWLSQCTRLPVDWVDERFTTAMAGEVLSHSKLSPKKRKAQLDKLAAQILLTTYLESHSPDRTTGPIDEG